MIVQVETEEMREIRHQRDELDNAYKKLKWQAVADFQKNPINTSLVGKYYKYGYKYFKILDVPQRTFGPDNFVKSNFNEYQFPALEVNLTNMDSYIDNESTVFVENGVPISPGGCYHDERGPDMREISEEEFKSAIAAFFEKYEVKGVF